ncbi:MAG TPA: hypothetical protein VJC17_03615 [Candidatus Dojkabacteria bacterium]|nr:hypothetical protein [Candidatus Dojkabacteria bacterium]
MKINEDGLLGQQGQPDLIKKALYESKLNLQQGLTTTEIVTNVTRQLLEKIDLDLSKKEEAPENIRVENKTTEITWKNVNTGETAGPMVSLHIG